jgi:hypothetical protein
MNFKEAFGFKPSRIEKSNTKVFRDAIKLAALRAALVIVFFGTPAVAHDNGQFGDVPPQCASGFTT